MPRPRRYLSNAARQAAYRQRRREPMPALQQYPRVQLGELVTLYQGDAHGIAPLLRGIDALISDPPYGTQFDFTKPRRSTRPLQGGEHWAPRWTMNVTGDDAPFDPVPWLGYSEVVLWGAQHFAAQLPNSPAWLVWDKRAGANSDAFSDVELAWTNLRTPARLFHHLWRGIIREGEENVSRGGKLHPCQKPIRLMEWCVSKTTGIVLDPFMGSGTTGVACVRLGRPFVGIEIEPAFFETACARLAEEVADHRQLPLLAPGDVA